MTLSPSTAQSAMRAAAPASVGEYSLWLMPAPEHERLLVETITRLTSQLHGARFEPHVTVQGDIQLPRARLQAPLATLAHSMPIQRWRVARVETSEHFFRCLYLRFDDNPVFAALQAAAQQYTRTAEGLSPYPHLSLVYGEHHADHARMGALLSDEFAGRDIVFDRLALCRSSKNIAIADWQCTDHYPLAPQ